jgi:hypothetical protein
MKAKILVLLLLFFLSFNAWASNLREPGIDFYYFWGVPKAQQLSPVQLSSPYLYPDTYADVLNQYANRTNDKRLKSVNAYRQTLDMTATPLLYTFFASFPKSYTWALSSYQGLQIVLFVAAIVLIGVFKGQPDNFLPLGLVLSAAAFVPFTVDLKVANLNAIQLFLLVLTTLFVDRVARNHPRKHLKSGLIILCLSIFMVLLKPNLLLPFVFLCLSFVLRYGIPRLTVLLPVSAAFTALIVLSTSTLLGSSRVWLDWYQIVSSSKDRLIYPIEGGNFSTTLLVSSISQVDTFVVVLGVLLILAISLCGAVVIPVLGKKLTMVNGVYIVTDIFKDTGLVVNLALTATLALSPLVWLHYYTLLLFPILWLLDFGRWSIKNLIALASLILLSGILIKAVQLAWMLSPEQQSLGYCIGCFLVWIGLLLAVSETVNKRLKQLTLVAE